MHEIDIAIKHVFGKTHDTLNGDGGFKTVEMN
jgi:hypothetical protein